MNLRMTNIFALLGFGCTIIIIISLFIFLFQILIQLIDDFKYQYRYKHRFDKPPMAKCFCRDCKQHCFETKKCNKFEGWHTADNWFCWDAEPNNKKYEVTEDKNG